MQPYMHSSSVPGEGGPHGLSAAVLFLLLAYERSARGEPNAFDPDSVLAQLQDAAEAPTSPSALRCSVDAAKAAEEVTQQASPWISYFKHLRAELHAHRDDPDLLPTASPMLAKDTLQAEIDLASRMAEALLQLKSRGSDQSHAAQLPLIDVLFNEQRIEQHQPQLGLTLLMRTLFLPPRSWDSDGSSAVRRQILATKSGCAAALSVCKAIKRRLGLVLVSIPQASK